MSQPLPCILVGVDFSPSSERAVTEARRLAGLMGAQLDFVHICPLPPSSPDLPNLTIDGAAFEKAQKQLISLEEAARADGFVAKSHFGIGSPVFGLIDFMHKIEPTLVVLGSHGHGAVMRLLLGSVAASIIRASRVPVLVVPAPERVAVTTDTAWSCRDCGHMLVKHESTVRCAGCGTRSPHWLSAPVTGEPIDAGLPSVGGEARDEVSGSDPAGLFATSPGGAGACDVNPELRVRY